jgi:hypothetical protein
MKRRACVPNRVAVGRYRWVRNPIYIGALAVILGETWLFTSIPLLIYAGEVAIVCHLFVIGYEERTLRRWLGDDYKNYLGAVRAGSLGGHPAFHLARRPWAARERGPGRRERRRVVGASAVNVR